MLLPARCAVSEILSKALFSPGGTGRGTVTSELQILMGIG